MGMGLDGTWCAVTYTRLWSTNPALMPASEGTSTEVTDSTPPIGSMSFDRGSTIAVLSVPSSATSLAATGLAVALVTGCTSTRAKPVAGIEPWSMVYGT